jgi:hypothetical protein
VARHPLPFFVVLPVLALPVLLFVVSAGEIVLDHTVFGRAANGMPLLETLPWARTALWLVNQALMYLAPVAIAAVSFLIGRAKGAAMPWLIAGGVAVCVLGAVTYIDASWTGVRGTSDLHLGVTRSAVAAMLRLGVNMAAFAGVVLLARKRV